MRTRDREQVSRVVAALTVGVESGRLQGSPIGGRTGVEDVIGDFGGNDRFVGNGRRCGFGNDRVDVVQNGRPEGHVAPRPESLIRHGSCWRLFAGRIEMGGSDGSGVEVEGGGRTSGGQISQETRQHLMDALSLIQLEGVDGRVGRLAPIVHRLQRGEETFDGQIGVAGSIERQFVERPRCRTADGREEILERIRRRILGRRRVSQAPLSVLIGRFLDDDGHGLLLAIVGLATSRRPGSHSIARDAQNRLDLERSRNGAAADVADDGLRRGRRHANHRGTRTSHRLQSRVGDGRRFQSEETRLTRLRTQRRGRRADVGARIGRRIVDPFVEPLEEGEFGAGRGFFSGIRRFFAVRSDVDDAVQLDLRRDGR